MKQNYITLQHKTSFFHSYLPTSALKFFSLGFAGLLCVLANQPVFAVDDAYLRALANEANTGAQPTKVAANSDYLDALSAEAEASAHVATDTADAHAKDRLEMEALLKKEKPTSFKYYKKLDADEKAKLAEAFRTDPADKEIKLGHLRKKILDLYFKR
jgi:hypothetical protein